MNYSSKQTLHFTEFTRLTQISYFVSRNQIKYTLHSPYVSALLNIALILLVSVELNHFFLNHLQLHHLFYILLPFIPVSFYMSPLASPHDNYNQACVLYPNPLPFLFPIFLLSYPDHFCSTLASLISTIPPFQFPFFQQEERPQNMTALECVEYCSCTS